MRKSSKGSGKELAGVGILDLLLQQATAAKAALEVMLAPLLLTAELNLWRQVELANESARAAELER